MNTLTNKVLQLMFDSITQRFALAVTYKGHIHCGACNGIVSIDGSQLYTIIIGSTHLVINIGDTVKVVKLEPVTQTAFAIPVYAR